MRSKLLQAAADGNPVRVVRWMERTPALDGFVVGVGRSWVLLQVLDEAIVLDGYAAVRIDDIHKVKPRPNPEFVRRALGVRGGLPCPLEPALPLDRTGDLLRAAGAAFPLLSVHQEYTDPGVFFVGAVTGWRRKQLRLSEIGPDARWRAEPTWWSLRQLTRIDVGGRYEQALWAVASDADQVSVPPAWSDPAS